MKNAHKAICKKCIMDNINDPDLVLDENTICNHCKCFNEAFEALPKGDDVKIYFDEKIQEIKNSKTKSKYNCIIGISGGVDSTYLCLLAKRQGLNPLLVHCDNGWNSELSVKNIENIVSKTGFDLDTLVIEWNEMKDLQLAFMKAGVVDLELPYDYALIITAYKAAEKYGIKYVLSGHNIVTEGTYLPKQWRHAKMDFTNINDIHNKFGKIKLRTYPFYSFFNLINIKRKIEHINLLNYIPYNKKEVKQEIMSEFGWRDYGGKHYENIFTRFYQGYILKEKFGFDKRQFHLSVLVQSGQISREEAILEYSKPTYPANQLAEDKLYVLKKLALSESDFEKYMTAPIRKHNEFKTVEKYWDIYFKVISYLKPIKKLIGK